MPLILSGINPLWMFRKDSCPTSLQTVSMLGVVPHSKHTDKCSVCSNSSAVEHLIYIQVVGGSIPSSSINKFSDANEGMKNVNCKM